MNKKLVSCFFLIPMIVVALAGCGKRPGGYDDDPSEWIGDGEAYNEIEDEEVDEISVFKNDWANFTTARQTNSPVYRKLKEKLGVDIEAVNSSASTWEQQESLMQAGGTLPDIYLTNGPDNSYLFNKFIQNGDVLPISDWVSEAHYPNIYNYLKQYNYMRKNIHYSHGKLWYIPSTWHNEKSLYVRKDWIDNLNAKLDTILVAEHIVSSASEITDQIREQYSYKVPTTLVEFYRLARAFTLYDPDGDGQKDTYGYVSESNKDMDSWIYIAYGAGWNQFIKASDGSYTYTDVADGSKFATAFIARMINEGYMSIDSLNLDMDGKQNKLMTNSAGMVFAHNWYTNFASALMENNGWTSAQVREKLVIVEPPAGETGLHGGHGDDTTWQGFCINKNMSNSRIRKCLEFYDYLLSDEGYDLLKYGVEGVHFTRNEDGSFKESLLPVDERTGLAIDLRYVDSATFLYALVEWTMQYKTECINFSDIVIPRERISERNSSFSDYPSLTTDEYVEYFDDAHKYFLEQIVKLEKDDIAAWDHEDANVNWKTFSWTDLKTLPSVFENKWKSIVKTYKTSYNGQSFLDAFNARINGGDVVKVDPSTYVFR